MRARSFLPQTAEAFHQHSVANLSGFCTTIRENVSCALLIFNPFKQRCINHKNLYNFVFPETVDLRKVVANFLEAKFEHFRVL